MSRATQVPANNINRISSTCLSHSMDGLSMPFDYSINIVRRRSYNPSHASTRLVWANPRSLATTCGITVVFFSSGYLDVSVPQVRLTLCVMLCDCIAGFPIRTSADHFVFADNRSFSQLITSFIASESHRHPPYALISFSFIVYL